MKKLRISFNDKVYEVVVEVLEDDESHYPGSTPTLTKPSRPASMPTPGATPRRPAGATGANQILAPIVGTVTKILVTVGESVKENQPLVVLDAMKLDTYINSTRNGVIQSIECRVGDNVSVGQRLLALQ